MESEKIKGEDWCPTCRRHVDNWIVSYESTIHSDSGYDRIRRCPHCNEMCVEDGGFSLGCLFFFIGLFGSGFLFEFVLGLAGREFTIESDGQAAVYMVLAVVVGAALSAVVTRLHKRYLYRNRLE